jgi:hypothetical protein
MTPATAALALLADLEASLDRQRTAAAGMAHATARAQQTTARARRLAGDARALLEEATG